MTFRQRFLVLLLGASTLGAQSATPSAARFRPADSVVVRQANEYFSRLAALGHNGGVLIMRDGRVLLRRSYGFADRDQGIRADSATVYNIGSITKQFTAATILRLEEQGKLRVSDSIGRFLPNVPADKRGITLHHLLTHTAGFESDFSPTDYEPTTRDEYVRRALGSRLRTPPGKAHYYANSGYSLLAAIVEIVTGKEYETALTELVLRPAGMLETGYKAPHWTPARVAHGYQNGRDWGTIVDRIAEPGAPYWALRGNGGLATTLDDFARWERALTSDRVLTDSSRRKFMTGYVDEGPLGLSQYAYGWAVTKSPRGTRVVMHNGGNGVYVAEFNRYVDEGVTLFVTSTNAQLPASPMIRALEHLVFGEPFAMPPAAASLDAAALAPLAGRYRIGDATLLIRASASGLMAEGIGQRAFALLNSGDTASAPGAFRASARADTIVRALVAGNLRPLIAANVGVDSAELAQNEAQLRAGRLERFGTFRSVEVLGTVPIFDGDLRTTVRLNYERGSATNLYTWDRQGRIVDIGAQPFAATPLVTVSATEFQTFDLRARASMRLRRDGDDLVAITPQGTVRLVRQKD
jgi:CubicO group peptidase (beta-lactamase class C family)